MAQEQQNQSGSYDVRMPDGTVVRVNNAPNPEVARARAAEFYQNRFGQEGAQSQGRAGAQVPARFEEQTVSEPSRTFLNIGGQRMLRNMVPFEDRQQQLQSGLEEGGLPGWAAYAPATLAARAEQGARVLGSGVGQSVRGLVDLGDTLSPANAVNTLLNRFVRSAEEQQEYRSPISRLTDQAPVPEVTGTGEEIASAIVQYAPAGLGGARAVSAGARGLRSALPALGDEASGIVGKLGQFGRRAVDTPGVERGAQVAASGVADAAVSNPRGQDRIALSDPGRASASDLERRGRAMVEGTLFAGVLSALAPIGKGAYDYVTNTLRDSFRGSNAVQEQLAVMLALSDGGRRELTPEDAVAATQLADLIAANTRRLREEGVDRVTLGAALELPEGASPELEALVTRAQNFYRTAGMRDTGEVVATERSMAQQMADNLQQQLAREGDQTASVAAAQDRSAAQSASFANLASAQGRASEEAAEGAAQVAESAQSALTPQRGAAAASQDFAETLAGPQGAQELSEMGAIGAVRAEARDLWRQSDAIDAALIAPVGRAVRRLINSYFPAPGTGKRPRSGGDVRGFTLVEAVEDAGVSGRRFLEKARSIANRSASGDLEFGEISALRRSMQGAEQALMAAGNRQAAQELRDVYSRIYEEAIEGIRQGSPEAAELAQRAVSFTRDQAPRIAGAGLPQAAITSAQRAGEFINPEQVLGRFMGSMRSASGGGASLASQLQDMRALIGEFSGKGPAARADQAIRDYARANFAEVAFRQGSDGSVIPNPGAAVRFIRQNKGALDELGLTSEFRAAAQGVSEASSRFREGLERARSAQREARQSQQMSDLYQANRAPNDPTQIMAAPGGSVEAAVFDAAKGGREGLETLDRLMAEAGGEQAQAGVRNAISQIVLREVLDPRTGRASAAGLNRLFGRNAKETNVRRIFDYAYPSGQEARTAQRYFRFLQNQTEAKNTTIRATTDRNITEGSRETNVVLASIFGIVEGRGITAIMNRVQRQALWGGRKVEDVVAEAASFMSANPERMEVALRAAAGNRQAREQAFRLADMFIANNVVSPPVGAPEMEPSE